MYKDDIEPYLDLFATHFKFMLTNYAFYLLMKQNSKLIKIKTKFNF